VSPEEGERLVLADTVGTLRLGLRNQDDGSTSPGIGITLRDLLGITEDGEPSAEDPAAVPTE
jgi:hypothetical protein